jgi:hypothetical protein
MSGETRRGSRRARRTQSIQLETSEKKGSSFSVPLWTSSWSSPGRRTSSVGLLYGS